LPTAATSLTPNSEFRIDDYRYNGELDGSERIAMQLVKGGLRTLSGAIGKAKQSAYEMITKAATIGIRGTEYTLLYSPQGGVTGSVAHGRIAVCNGAGCVDVDLGKSFVVIDRDSKPSLTDTAADLGTPPPGRPSANETASEARHVARDDRNLPGNRWGRVGNPDKRWEYGGIPGHIALGPVGNPNSNGWGPGGNLNSNGWGPGGNPNSNGWGPGGNPNSNGWGPGGNPKSGGPK
jgi:FecR protein